jgi:hypothetical protein
MVLHVFCTVFFFNLVAFKVALYLPWYTLQDSKVYITFAANCMHELRQMLVLATLVLFWEHCAISRGKGEGLL